MTTSRLLSRFLALPASFLFTAAAQDIPVQAARGQVLFFETAKPIACGTCHSLAAKGTEIGPDVARWAKINPRAVAMVVKSTITENVIVVKAGKDPEFPSMKGKEDGDKVTLYDLGKNPPTLVTLAKAGFTTKVNASWKHPPSEANMSAQDLADVISYIRWVGNKDGKAVKPEDVE